MRSDTVTRPCDKMRDAIANAVVGDDIYSDCPTTNKLQSDVAELFGKEAALLVASGTQANCTSMMAMAPIKGDSVVMGSMSHLVNYERGSLSQTGSVMPWVVANQPNGTMDLKLIEKAAFYVKNEHIVPITGISLESSHNNCSG